MLALAAPAQAAPPIRIMPVGDSITYGASTPGGYRLPLYQMLSAAGYNVDFVGTQTSNPAGALPDSDHEGHSGWTISGIDGIILGVFDQVADPDAILVMIGTNDYGGGNGAGATNRLEALIARMAAARPHAKIIVSTLTPRGEPQETQIQTTFNPVVDDIVARQAALGRQVYYTDLHSALTLADTYDSLHPNARGYAKMATNWFQRVTELFSPEGSTNAPAIARATAVPGLTNVIVTFSKPVADSAAAATNFTLSGGVAVLGAALDPAAQRDVRLTTAPQTAGTTYTLTVNHVRDRTATQTPIAPDSTATFRALADVVRGASNHVAEAADYRLVYSLDIPTQPNYRTALTYTTDRRATAGTFYRVAYYLELQPTNGTLSYVWASMDRFTTNVNHIGVPTAPSGAMFQQRLTNLTVVSSVSGVVAGTNLAGGNIEFWPHDYSGANAVGVPNSGGAYDSGDTRSAGGTYGSMQIHNHAARQTVFAFNRWGGSGGNADLGIGNRAGSTDTDWTFAQNAAGYSIRTLQVYVAPLADGPAPVLLGASAPTTLASIDLQFDRPLDDNATNVANYAVSGGVTVHRAALNPITRTGVTLATSPLVAIADYTVTVNNLRNLSSDRRVIAADSIATFRTPAGRGVVANIPGIEDWRLVYSLNIPDTPGYLIGAPYDADAHTAVSNFTRVAYYLELQPVAGNADFAWAEADPFATDANKIGVPTVPTGAIFQQSLTNLTVRSSVAGVVNGTNMPGGHIEFWPGNYNASNVLGIAGASHTVYDWGDNRTAGSYGSMQIHNVPARQTVFAFNRWGGTGGTADLGIGNQSTGNPDWTFAQNAAGYAVKTLQVYVKPADPAEAPRIARARGLAGWTNVLVTFSKPVAATATNTAFYALSGGLTVLRAAPDPYVPGSVVLTTSPQVPGAGYTLTVNGVTDATAAHTPLAPNATVTFAAVARAGLANNVPEAAAFTPIYTLPIPNLGVFKDATAVPYSLDRSAWPLPRGYDRVAYYMELEDVFGLKWVYVSMDDFANQSLKALGLPHNRNNPLAFQRAVDNLNVLASANTGITPGTSLATGSIEMWPGNYAQTNALSIPNASSTAFDFGDRNDGGVGAGHGSFQVHNHGAREVLFAYNRWGGGNTTGSSELGIGNRPETVNIDWTHAQNAPTYTVKTLQILVRPRAADPNARAAAARARVPEAAKYELIYDLAIPVGAAFNSALIPYAIDQSGALPPSLGRIAYHLELGAGAATNWLFVSMNAFTQQPRQTGVPSRGPNGNGNAVFQQPVTNMNVYASTTASVLPGIGIPTGSIEFWSSNYTAAVSAKSPPNANGGTYDFGDTPSAGSHASMQVHNYDIDGAGPGTAGQTLFAYNNWGANAAGQSALGIGNNTVAHTDGKVHPDWTFRNNAGSYSLRHLQVLALPRVFVNVPEAAGYDVVYALDIPNGAATAFHATGAPYGIDRSAALAGKRFTRVAYYLELQTASGTLQWVFVSADAFTQDLGQLGVPAGPAAQRWQQRLTGMNIAASSGAPVATGTGLDTGWIEFWPHNYGTANEAAVPGASGSEYDWGDDVAEDVPQGYGSMQIHNTAAGQVVFAYNAWGNASRIGDIGIGNNAVAHTDGKVHKDWTFRENAASYTVKNLFVLANVSSSEQGTLLLVR